MTKGYFKNGKPEGIWEHFYETGQLKKRRYSINGEFQTEESFHTNGLLKYRGNLKNNKQNDT